MSKLTDEQLEQARQAVISNHKEGQHGDGIPMTIEVLRTAAPYLQVPWDEPTAEEARTAKRSYEERHGYGKGWMHEGFISEFVRRRNDALLPKPVDPREIAILKAYDPCGYTPDRDLMDRLLAALDEVKP